MDGRELAQEDHDGLPRKLAQEDRDGLPRKLAQEDHDGWPRKLAQEGRDGWPRKLAQQDHDGWPRKLAQEDRDVCPRKLAQEDRDGWPRKLAQEDRDGLPRTVATFDAGPRGVNPSAGHTNIVMNCSDNFLGYRVNLKRERAELREGLPGKIEKVVTHEGKEVEKIVKGSRRVDGVFVDASISCRNTSISLASVKHGKAIPSCHAKHAQTLLHC